MAFLRRFIYIALIASTITWSGCGAGKDTTNAGNTVPINAAQTEIKANSSAEELALLINFNNLEPDDLVWRRDEGRKTLVAVIRLDQEDTKKLADQLATRAPGSPYSVQVEDWFPAELVAQSEASGGSAVEGTAFPADDFYQDPYTKGVAVRVSGSDFFVIELAARQQ